MLSSARLEGAWNLILLAGVQVYEIFLAHFIFVLIECLIVIMNGFLTAIFFPEFEINQNFWVVFWLLLTMAIPCILFSFWISCSTTNFLQICYINGGMAITATIICGIIW